MLPRTRAMTIAKPTGREATFKFFNTTGITMGPTRAGNRLSKAGAITGFVRSGAMMGARNSMPQNTMAVVTKDEAATASMATTRPFSLPSSHSMIFMAFKAAGSFIFWMFPVEEARYTAPGPMMGAMDSFSHSPVMAKISIMGAAAFAVAARSIFSPKITHMAAGTRRKKHHTTSVEVIPSRWIRASNC